MITDIALIAQILKHAGAKFERHQIADVLSDLGYNIGEIHSVESFGGIRAYAQEHMSSLPVREALESMRGVIDLEHQLLPVLARMEAHGVFLDQGLISGETLRMQERIGDLKKEIYNCVGEEFNISSPKQLQYILFEKLSLASGKKTKTGYSVDAEVLEYLSDKHSSIPKILEYRTLTKLLGTYFEALPRSILPQTGRIHPTLVQLGTTTGRIACEDPNLQNIPAHGEGSHILRSAFRPQDPNTCYVVADFSQMELKILANISQDPVFIQAFLSGKDIHTNTAEFLFGHTNISGDERRIAKAVNFGVIYGVSGFGLMKTTGLSRKDSTRFIEAFYELYPGVRAYYEQALEKVRSLGYAETFLGRRRYIDGINDSNKMIRSAAEREAMNMPIQGAGADVLKLTLVKLQAIIDQSFPTVSMILCVHDEIIFEVPKDLCGEFCSLLSKEIVYHDLGSIPLSVDIGIGDNWWSAKY